MLKLLKQYWFYLALIVIIILAIIYLVINLERISILQKMNEQQTLKMLCNTQLSDYNSKLSATEDYKYFNLTMERKVKNVFESSTFVSIYNRNGDLIYYTGPGMVAKELSDKTRKFHKKYITLTFPHNNLCETIND